MPLSTRPILALLGALRRFTPLAVVFTYPVGSPAGFGVGAGVTGALAGAGFTLAGRAETAASALALIVDTEPALVLADSITRMQPGVLAADEAFEKESHYASLLEYPQYTRPEEWEGEKVPEVLLSGHHKNIEKWRLEKAIENTRLKRPDLYKKYTDSQNN